VCGSFFYPEVTANMRSKIPVDEIMNRVDTEWIRGVSEVSESKMMENHYLKK